MKPEEYLLKDYNIIYNEELLKTEEDIKDYFNECSLFDCGQGYYEDVKMCMCMTQENRYYNVTVTASVGSSKQEYGCRLYYIEEIDDISFCEIEKPLLLERKQYTFVLNLSDIEYQYISSYLKNYV